MSLLKPKPYFYSPSCGILGKNYTSLGGIDKIIPVDVYAHGCPPTPVAMLNGILKAVE
ncbi:MAG: hypothetical protein HZB54_08460 [Deltaproteobacteria bacterium]|nr:hypothetical protein [Deltaproteobacteria bacterium]